MKGRLEILNKKLNDDHTLVLDVLVLAPEICLPLVVACALTNNLAEGSQLRRVAKKLLLCFPDKIPEGQETVRFDIPVYIVEELKQILNPQPPEKG